MQDYNEAEAHELILQIKRDQDEAREALRRVGTLETTLINTNQTVDVDRVLAACLRIQWRWRGQEIL